MKKGGGPLMPTVPKGTPPKNPKQTSGKTKHARMSTGAKVESSSNLPKVR